MMKIAFALCAALLAHPFDAWAFASRRPVSAEGISFEAPGGQWRAADDCGDCIGAWRRSDGSRIGLKWLPAGGDRGADRSLADAAGSYANSAAVEKPISAKLGSNDAEIVVFSPKGDPAKKGALITLKRKGAGLGVVCTSGGENFLQVFLECRRLASSLIAGETAAPAASKLHESGMAALRRDPARAAGLFEAAIASDPGLAAAYLNLGRALLARGDSAEMVAARLARLLDRAPDTPDIRGMRERLARIK
ncbi:MAG: tetratricopeptide repeat protein [Proteobacteria bacterium]|nr:tetratricopeptide repeat protein [Pseudomonadota bacterium]